uniref:Transposase n=1 Tax=Ralstonia solanacearum CFBP2957 TaxID=859656 RepID=D8P266_RALSL|nr:protein of unknown function [Ralstonia solanacearum CFBP2957]
MIEAIPPIRGKRGRPLFKPAIVQGDLGYYHDKCHRQPHAAVFFLTICLRMRTSTP